jgi:hypothetical protein
MSEPKSPLPVSHAVPALDELAINFDDTHAVASAGLLLAATPTERLGIQQAADQLIDLIESLGNFQRASPSATSANSTGSPSRRFSGPGRPVSPPATGR